MAVGLSRGEGGHQGAWQWGCQGGKGGIRKHGSGVVVKGGREASGGMAVELSMRVEKRVGLSA